MLGGLCGTSRGLKQTSIFFNFIKLLSQESKIITLLALRRRHWVIMRLKICCIAINYDQDFVRSGYQI